LWGRLCEWERQFYNGSMKLKHCPADFQVEEIPSISANQGEFAYYRLSKRGLGTPEAVAAVAQRWNVPMPRIAFGGLKDRHAETIQYLTIERGPRRNLQQTNLELEYLGQVDRPYRSSDITANRFQITLRDLEAEEAQAMAAELPQAAEEGVANYFDAQRFGSLGESGEFMGAAWCRREHERALWLALADSNSADRPRERAEREHLRQIWGDWPQCRRLPGPIGQVAEHLVANPGDFRRAFARLPQTTRRMQLEAFQSCVWNRMLAGWLRRRCRPEQLIETSLPGHHVVQYRRLDAAQRAEVRSGSLPLPSARLHIEPGPVEELIREALQPTGLRLRDLQVDYPRDSFFSKGDRAMALWPEEVSHEVRPDDVYAGRWQLVLSFRLARGCYATMLVRRLAVAAGQEA